MRRRKSTKQKRKSVKRKSVRRKSVRRKSKKIRYNKTDGSPLPLGEKVYFQDLQEGEIYDVFDNYEDKYIGNGILHTKFQDINQLYFIDFKKNDFEEPGERVFDVMFYSFYKF